MSVERRTEYIDVEKIIEREVVKEVHVGISEDELQRIQDEAEQEKAAIRERAERDLAEILERQVSSFETRVAFL